MNTHENDTQAELDAVTEQRDRLAEAIAWQPIETAPKDKTEILTLHPQFGFLLTRWLGSREMWKGWAVIPTHWIPLPEPPTNPEPNEL